MLILRNLTENVKSLFGVEREMMEEMLAAGWLDKGFYDLANITKQ
jgi:hypothetical protein